MNNDVEVMLYVTDVDREAKFWQSVGFVERDRQDMGTTEMVQMAPSEDGAFAFTEFLRVNIRFKTQDAFEFAVEE